MLKNARISKNLKMLKNTIKFDFCWLFYYNTCIIMNNNFPQSQQIFVHDPFTKEFFSKTLVSIKFKSVKLLFCTKVSSVWLKLANSHYIALFCKILQCISNFEFRTSHFALGNYNICCKALWRKIWPDIILFIEDWDFEKNDKKILKVCDRTKKFLKIYLNIVYYGCFFCIFPHSQIFKNICDGWDF
eukprot:TRINITY_DN10797_c1_g1_i2.p1 TRINITY_DN10797_c1_g1~~TRINITY_DN10797_c1_g1_i2.p1  ORF type:complete len:187 (+),score=-2.62 TRINITY_DN10797_c1_g1_i2:1-561(+)